MRIAVVGGQYFDTNKLDAFLFKLAEKYPNATIVTGQGRGAEKHAAESAKLLGFNVEQLEVTEQQEEWFGAEALNCQVSDICYGADVILVVSSGKRPDLALAYWHRINMHQRDNRQGLAKKNGEYISLRTPENRIQLFQIAGAKPNRKKRTKQPEPVAA